MSDFLDRQCVKTNITQIVQNMIVILMIVLPFPLKMNNQMMS